jgi:hypothetical protein
LRAATLTGIRRAHGLIEACAPQAGWPAPGKGETAMVSPFFDSSMPMAIRSGKIVLFPA